MRHHHRLLLALILGTGAIALWARRRAAECVTPEEVGVIILSAALAGEEYMARRARPFDQAQADATPEDEQCSCLGPPVFPHTVGYHMGLG